MSALQIVKFESKENDEKDEIKRDIKPILRKDVTDWKRTDTVSIELMDKGSYMLIPSELDVTKKDVISCLCISDTHGQHEGIETKFSELPSADILIHSGDFTKIGHWGDIRSYDSWIKNKLNSEKFKYCILIGGNHDITLDSQYYILSGYNRFHAGNPLKEDIIRYGEKCRNRAKKHSIYLQDSEINLFNLKLYGSPWVPYFNNWAFMLRRGNELRKKWNNMAKDIDILITHGPPIYHNDLSDQYDIELESNCVGDVELMKKIMEIKPQFHIFGHNHEGYGVTMHNGLRTVFINASTLNRDYKIANKPIMFYVQSSISRCRKSNDKNLE